MCDQTGIDMVHQKLDATIYSIARAHELFALANAQVYWTNGKADEHDNFRSEILKEHVVCKSNYMKLLQLQKDNQQLIKENCENPDAFDGRLKNMKSEAIADMMRIWEKVAVHPADLFPKFNPIVFEEMQPLEGKPGPEETFAHYCKAVKHKYILDNMGVVGQKMDGFAVRAKMSFRMDHVHVSEKLLNHLDDSIQRDVDRAKRRFNKIPFCEIVEGAERPTNKKSIHLIKLSYEAYEHEVRMEFMAWLADLKAVSLILIFAWPTFQ